MFWKLVKYEFQSMRLWYLGIYGLALLLSLPIGFMLRHLSHTAQAHETQPGPLFITFFVFLILALIVVLGTIFVATLVIIIRRFSTNIFGREGYLMNTLPVNAHQLILSKLLPAIVWDILSALVVLLCFAIVMLINVDTKDLLIFASGFGQSLDSLGGAILFIPSIFLSTLTSIMLYYLCISIGNLFQNNKILMGFVAYFAITTTLFIMGVLLGFGSLVAGSSLENVSQLGNNYIFAIIENLIMFIVYYAGTHYILSKRLNLN